MVPVNTSVRSNAGRPEPADGGVVDVERWNSCTVCRMRSKMPLLTAQAGQ